MHVIFGTFNMQKIIHGIILTYIESACMQNEYIQILYMGLRQDIPVLRIFSLQLPKLY